MTLETIRRAKTELGVKTALGVSNVSFGLPKREQLNQSFFTMALHQGLDGAIINPLSGAMMGAYRSYRALMGLDDQCQEYMEAFREEAPALLPPRPQRGEVTLHQAVCRGLKEGAAAQAKALADQGREILDIINGELVPALDEVGKGFEKGTLFLPQLLMSAEAAKEAFGVLKEYLPASQSSGAPQIILATVKGTSTTSARILSRSCWRATASGCWTWGRTWPRKPLWRPSGPRTFPWWACPP